MLNAGFAATPEPDLLGQWAAQLDRLGSPLELARATLRFYASGIPDEVLVTRLWGSVLGQPITPADVGSIVGLLDSGVCTQASLLELPSTLPLNTDEIAGIVEQPVATFPVWFLSPPPPADAGRSGLDLETREMRDRRMRRLVQCVLMCCGWLVAAAASSAPFDAEVLMNWAERSYPQLFPGPQPTLTSPPYVYRCYPNGNCAGVADGIVYIYGPVAGGALQAVGPMAQFECQAVPANCPAPELPRLAVGARVGVVVDGQGRHLAWGSDALTPASAGTPVSDTALRVLASSARQVVVYGGGGMTLLPDGQVWVWGTTFGPSLAPFDKPWRLELPGPAVQLTPLSGTEMMALLADGSVWQIPGDRVAGSFVIRPRRFDIPVRIASLNQGTHIAGGLAADGTAWMFDIRAGYPAAPMAGVTGARTLHCSYGGCAAVMADGQVRVWYTGTTTTRVVPGVTNAVQAVAGSRPGGTFIVVQTATGELMLWRGIGSPGPLERLEVGGGRATDIACDGLQCAFLLQDRTVWGWDSTASLTPARLSGVTVPGP